jgi:hypothetical protein
MGREFSAVNERAKPRLEFVSYFLFKRQSIPANIRSVHDRQELVDHQADVANRNQLRLYMFAHVNKSGSGSKNHLGPSGHRGLKTKFHTVLNSDV